MTPTITALPLLEVDVLRALRLGAASSKQFLSAGSGIAIVSNWAYVVADDELFLAGFRLDRDQGGVRIRLFDGTLPEDHDQRKRLKPDLESLLHLPKADGKPGYLFAVPSGSKKNRYKGALVALTKSGSRARKSPVKEISFKALFRKLGDDLKIPGLNIEGTALDGETLCFFQRGNTTGSINCVIELDARGLLEELLSTGRVDPKRLRGTTRVELPSLRGVPLTFTDSCVHGGKRWVVMAAEDTTNAYADGESKGSVLAYIDATGQLHIVGELNFPHKIEGIFVEDEDDALRFHFVTDADDRKIASTLLTLRLPATV